MKKTVSNTLAAFRADGFQGILQAEEILTAAGCRIVGTTLRGKRIELPDDGIKPNRANKAAFEFLTEDWAYSVTDIQEETPAEV